MKSTINDLDTDVFSKTKAEILTHHYPYDFKINLEEGCYESKALGLDSKVTLYRVYTRELDRVPSTK